VRKGKGRAVRAAPKLPGPLEEDPILRKAVKDPAAFVGGLFAGVLQLDVGDNPLREWIERTARDANLDPKSLKRQVVSSTDEGRETTNGTEEQG